LPDDDWLRLYREDNEADAPPMSAQYHGHSHAYMGNSIKGHFRPAVRGYSKVYQGDFDDDGNPDLITWEKVYKAYPKTAAETYERLDNTLTHYERDLTAQALLEQGVTGDYLPQTTDQATIQQWLSAANLTWQKGFPSHSECEGEEGELIPEMHDPLLNDPEVLQ